MVSRRARITIIAVAATLALIILYRIRGILTPFILGIVIAYIFNPVVNYFEERGAPRFVGIVIVYMGLVLSLGLIILYAFPIVVEQLEGLIGIIPGQTSRIERSLEELYDKYENVRIPDTLRGTIDQNIERIQGLLERLAQSAAQIILSLFSKMLSLIISPVLAFYFTRDFPVIKKKLLNWIPIRYRTETVSLLEDVNCVLSGFIRGQVVVASFVGLMTTIGLSLLGIEFALLIGFLAGILDLIPYIGPVAAAIPAAVLGFMKSPLYGLYVILFIFVVQQIESAIIAPKIVGDYVGLHPLVIIFALLVGGSLYGFLGVLLAVPAAAILRVVVRHLWPRLVQSKDEDC